MSAALAALPALVLALDGEAVTGNSTGLAVLSVVSMVFGYLLLAALWYFVFRDKARSRSKRKRDERD